MPVVTGIPVTLLSSSNARGRLAIAIGHTVLQTKCAPELPGHSTPQSPTDGRCGHLFTPHLLSHQTARHGRLRPPLLFFGLVPGCGRRHTPLLVSCLTGLQSLSADWNLNLYLTLHTDSLSAKVVAARRGAGKSTRHKQTRMPWLQERTAATNPWRLMDAKT